MYVQKVENILEIEWAKKDHDSVNYAQVHLESEYEFSKYHFEIASVKRLLEMFKNAQAEALHCLRTSSRYPLMIL